MTHQKLTEFSRFKILALAGTVAFLASLTACGNRDDGQTIGQKLDAAVANTGQAAAEAKAKAEASVAKAGVALKEGTQKAEVSGSSTAQVVSGSIEDMAITASVAAGFAKDADLSAIKINVDTKNGNVTLYGPAPTAAAREKATTIAKSIKGVNTVDNKLVVKGS